MHGEAGCERQVRREQRAARRCALVRWLLVRAAPRANEAHGHVRTHVPRPPPVRRDLVPRLLRGQRGSLSDGGVEPEAKERSGRQSTAPLLLSRARGRGVRVRGNRPRRGIEDRTDRASSPRTNGCRRNLRSADDADSRRPRSRCSSCRIVQARRFPAAGYRTTHRRGPRRSASSRGASLRRCLCRPADACPSGPRRTA